MKAQHKLIGLRKDNKITQEKLAELLEIDVSTYRNKELGKSSFSLDEAIILSNYFKEPIEQIFLNKNITNRDN